MQTHRTLCTTSESLDLDMDLLPGTVLLHILRDPLWWFPMDARALSMGLGRSSPLDDPLRVPLCSKPDRSVLVPRPNGIAPQST